MKLKLLTISLISLLSISASQAVTFSFEDVRLPSGAGDQGTVDSGVLAFVSATAAGSPSITATYTLTADFDGDMVDDILTFELTATAATGNIGTNANGNIGTGSPRIGTGESLTYTASISSIASGSGDPLTATFDGFDGGAFAGGSNFEDGSAFTANGELFDTPEFDLASSSTSLEIEVTANGGAAEVFINGIDFQISVGADPVPEPSGTALLGLGALGLIARRRR